MVEVVSKIFVKEDKVNEFVGLFKEMIEPTKKEEGFIRYEMYQDEKDPTILIVIEEWETREAFDKHLQTKHFERIGPKMTKLMAKESDVNICNKIA